MIVIKNFFILNATNGR